MYSEDAAGINMTDLCSLAIDSEAVPVHRVHRSSPGNWVTGPKMAEAMAGQ